MFKAASAAKTGAGATTVLILVSLPLRNVEEAVSLVYVLTLQGGNLTYTKPGTGKEHKKGSLPIGSGGKEEPFKLITA